MDTVYHGWSAVGMAVLFLLGFVLLRYLWRRIFPPMKWRCKDCSHVGIPKPVYKWVEWRDDAPKVVDLRCVKCGSSRIVPCG